MTLSKLACFIFSFFCASFFTHAQSTYFSIGSNGNSSTNIQNWSLLDGPTLPDSMSYAFYTVSYISASSSKFWKEDTNGLKYIYKLELTMDTNGKVINVAAPEIKSNFCLAMVKQLFYEMPPFPILKNIEIKNNYFMFFDLITTLSPGLKEAFYEKGIDYFEKNQYPKAIKEFTYSLDHYPYYTDAYYNRAASYLLLQDTVNACIDWKKAGKLDDLECKQLYIKNSKGK